MRMHPLALAESGWVWVGAGPAEDAPREGGALPKPSFNSERREVIKG